MNACKGIEYQTNIYKLSHHTTSMTKDNSAKSDVKALTPEEKVQKAREYRNNYFKKRYHSDPEFRERIKRHVLKSRARNREKYNAKQNEWRKANREKSREYMRQWRNKNREKIRKYKKIWDSKREENKK